jgi:FkbM family methyltransferase
MNKIKFKRKIKIQIAIFVQRIIGVRFFNKLINLLKLKKNDEIEIISNYYIQNSKNGTMFDVGAQIGNSMHTLASAGWEAYCFEPNPICFDILSQRAKFFKNKVKIFDLAVSDKSNLNLNFYISDGNLGISSLHPFTESHRKLKRVKTISLKKFIIDQKIKKINFLKIDTEGNDLSVLKGIDWDKLSPETILCEYEDKKTLKIGYNYKDICNLLKAKGYEVIISEWEPIIKYGGNHRWLKFHKFCKEIKVNNNSWGNIIASKDKKLISYIYKQSI